MQNLFLKHVELLTKNTAKSLSKTGFEKVIIHSGEIDYYYKDDMGVRFKPTPHFNHWCPAPLTNSFVILDATSRPTLIQYTPDDYWHDHSQPDHSWWSENFDIEFVRNTNESLRALKKIAGKNTAWIGPEKYEGQLSCQFNPDTLLRHLDWARSFKSEYELACSSEATRLAANGHKAAKKRFLEGGTERQVYASYLAGCDQTDSELPYHAIICLNEKAAILHYEGRRRNPTNGNSFLIDAGCAHHGYASDITRTYVNPKSELKSKDLFAELIRAVDSYQLKLCDLSRPGVGFAEVQMHSHSYLAQTLLDYKIIQNCDVESAIENEVTWSFYPHGVGHMLGIQVHDVAGKLVSPETDPTKTQYPQTTNPIYKYLRNKRKIAVGNLFTIEPGLYFIKSLLDKVPESKKQFYNWDLIEELMPFGGIRIEDNIFVQEKVNFNLTRKYLD